jgi:hypothetical protein
LSQGHSGARADDRWGIGEMPSAGPPRGRSREGTTPVRAVKLVRWHRSEGSRGSLPLRSFSP